MPNIAAMLKAEVTRLTRKELKLQIEPLRKEIGTQRKLIATLRADVAKLQRGIASGGRKAVAVRRAENAPVTRARFSASGLRKLRKKLGLTMESFGILLGVSAQTIFMWEHGQNRPRAESVQKIAIARSMTSRQVEDLLTQHVPSAKPAPRRKRKPSDQKAGPTPTKKAAKKAAVVASARMDRSATSTKKSGNEDSAMSTAPPATKTRRYKVIKKAEQQASTMAATTI